MDILGRDISMFDKDGAGVESLDSLLSDSGRPYIEDAMESSLSSLPDDIHYAFNENQIASKKWLIDAVHRSLGGRFGSIYILGGWYGALGAMLLKDQRFEINRVLSFDIDPVCEAAANRVNQSDVERGRFKAVTADVRDLDFHCFDETMRDEAPAPNLLINTSCEHIESTPSWYSRVPEGMLQAYQSNDYFDCDEHVNCMRDIAAFKKDLPMTELCHEDSLARRRYTRFMLIGRK